MNKRITPKGQSDHREINDRILDATAECLSKFGNRRTSVNDIAANSGLSRATIYNHFKNRSAITTALMRRELSRMQSSILSGLNGSTSSEDIIVECVTLFVLSIRSHPLFQRMIELEPGLVLPWFTTRSGFLARSGTQLFVPYLDAAMDRGDFTCHDKTETAEWLTMVALSLVFALDTFPHLRDSDLRDLVRTHAVRGLVS
ncbi:TetR/AcrR family transcriptional regulator [Salipiger sp. P9]|uniref:TetR/AcrR family transcriptional regulator n=1 Tax=Salipiger pentaromativorans TaxID=2943193 RepID=UPI0021571D69|nr:TetR/AcrR family transcriptional regulator [Salipiger pentaromativorans]MCR8547587.1 TetR/AcrR family transcriptional regulator [Salipiger pentaromativorans]